MDNEIKNWSGGLSFWLVPPADQSALIQSIMPRRPVGSLLPGGDPLFASSYPAFLPHITLASVRSGSELPADLLTKFTEIRRSVRANFRSLEVSDHYFRSVLVAVETTTDLLALHEEIRSALSHLSPSAPMFPHMSLSYIADEDANTGERARAAQLMKEAGVVYEDEGHQTMSLRCGEACLSGFDGEEIWLVNCEGPVEQWVVCDKKALRSR